MKSKNKKILIGAIIGITAVALLFAVFLLGRSCSGKPTGAATDATSPTMPITKTITVTKTTTTTARTAEAEPTPEPPSGGPYATMADAIAHVEAGGMMALEPATTWQPDAILHVIHATPVGTASYGGDYYYFFVNGYSVGERYFTSAQSSLSDYSTFTVTYNVYLPADPHCCPSGGIHSVDFHWDGSTLMTIGSMDGATM